MAKTAAPRSLKVAAIQLQSTANVAENLATLSALCERAAAEGARLLLLPENFAYFGPESGKPAVAENLLAGGPIQTALNALAARLGVHIVAGGMPEQSPVRERPYNTAALFGPRGLVAVYRKTHLFDVVLPDGTTMAESNSTLAGDAVVVADVDGIKVGLAICYDLRFPLLFQALSRAGAELIALTAAFTEQTGKDHWHVLNRARAIETQTFVAAAAQWGSHELKPRTYGHSLICDPWGTVIAECGEGIGYALATLDFAYLDAVRQRLPCLQHRRDAFGSSES
jgi:predicted amidohydrolase